MKVCKRGLLRPPWMSLHDVAYRKEKPALEEDNDHGGFMDDAPSYFLHTG